MAKRLVIAVDDGHEYNTAGKRTPHFEDGSFMNEWEFNSAVKKYLIKELKRAGFEVVDVNPDKKYTSLSDRVKKANEAGADFYISIHANAFTGKWGNAKGIETYIWPSANGKSEKIGRIIHKFLMKGTDFRDRGVKDGSWLYVIRKTKMPSVLVECGFMDNLREAKLLLTESYRKECAVEIAKGICEGFGVKYVEEKELEVEKLEGTATVTASSLNVRKTPDTTYSPLGKVKKEDKLEVIGKVKASDGDTWYQITYKGTAFVHGGYVDFKSKPEPKEYGSLYRVQVGAFSSKKNADDLAAELKKKGFPAYIYKD